MQIIDANNNIHDFTLRVVYPQGPFDALGVLNNNQLVYPNDELEFSPRAFSLLTFATMGYRKERMFFTGLNSESNPTNVVFSKQAKINGSWVQMHSWDEEGVDVVGLQVFTQDVNLVIGTKVKVTTPKGSFILTVVEE